MRMIVNQTDQPQTSSSAGGGGHSPGVCAFTVKNMAKRPAKNISSLDSQTMVPTLTMFGRFSECTRWLMLGAAVVTRRIMSCEPRPGLVGSRIVWVTPLTGPSGWCADPGHDRRCPGHQLLDLAGNPRRVGRGAVDTMTRVRPRSSCRRAVPMSESRRILVFSHRPEVRETIITAVGRRPAADVGRVVYEEVGTVA